MLGKAADHFMRAQANEQVLAMTPNGGGKGYNPPDQERSGTPHVMMRRGMTAPSSQKVVVSGALPGMGKLQVPRGTNPTKIRQLWTRNTLAGLQPSGALPGMGHYPLGRGTPGAVAGFGPSGALPGMGTWRQPSGALPGMGGLGGFVDDMAAVLPYVTVGAVIYFVMYGKNFWNK